MKKIWLLVMVLSFCRIYTANGETIFTKFSDTVLKVSETKEVFTEDNVTLSDLKSKKAELEKNKLEYDTTINAQIAEIDKKISEAKKLGIFEIDAKGDVIQ